MKHLRHGISESTVLQSGYSGAVSAFFGGSFGYPFSYFASNGIFKKLEKIKKSIDSSISFCYNENGKLSVVEIAMKQPYEAPCAEKVAIKDTNVLENAQIKTAVEGGASDNSWFF